MSLDSPAPADVAPKGAPPKGAPPKGAMPEGGAGDTLRHLLELEAAARELVDNAGAEANRRITEGEKSNRALREERCAACAAELDVLYEREIAETEKTYREQLAAYRAELDAMPCDREKFNQAAGRFLAGGR